MFADTFPSGRAGILAVSGPSGPIVRLVMFPMRGSGCRVWTHASACNHMRIGRRTSNRPWLGTLSVEKSVLAPAPLPSPRPGARHAILCQYQAHLYILRTLALALFIIFKHPTTAPALAFVLLPLRASTGALFLVELEAVALFIAHLARLVVAHAFASRLVKVKAVALGFTLLSRLFRALARARLFVEGEAIAFRLRDQPWLLRMGSIRTA